MTKLSTVSEKHLPSRLRPDMFIFVSLSDHSVLRLASWQLAVSFLAINPQLSDMGSGVMQGLVWQRASGVVGAQESLLLIVARGYPVAT